MQTKISIGNISISGTEAAGETNNRKHRMRTEYDTMGAVEVPENVYYGAQTQRAVENFPISGKTMPPEFIHALGLVKWACADANQKLGLFTKSAKPINHEQVKAILQAALEVAGGKWDTHFPVDVFQTGSGTSTNMNANEVIANKANEIVAYEASRGNETAAKAANDIHPNDHVNLGQSTNDIFPTALNVALTLLLRDALSPAVEKAVDTLHRSVKKWNAVIKIGRTHLADATPMTLGQEFSGLAAQMESVHENIIMAMLTVRELPIGGTAVGTGINTHPKMAELAIEGINDRCGKIFEDTQFIEAENHFAANAQRDTLVTAHSLIKSAAVMIMNIANHIRWLGSGPRCGFYEITIPDLQPGSSIMPGKVNPVLCEALMQVCAKVIGNDAAITACSITGGQFQLNIMMPVMADLAIESVRILANALGIFTEKCLKGLEANEEKCKENVEKSLMLATALAPHIGYEKSAGIAKEAFKTGKTIREICLEQNVLPEKQLDEVLDPMKMCGLR